MPPIQEAAIDMQRVEPMLDIQKFCDHVISSVQLPKRGPLNSKGSRS